MRFSTSTILSLLASLTVAQAELQSYFVDCGNVGDACPGNVLEAISDAGGTNIESHDEGWATFDSETLIEVNGVTIFPNFNVVSIGDVHTSDDSVNFEVTAADLPEERRRLSEEKRHRQAQGTSYPPFAFDDDVLINLQWHHEAVGSVAAWQQGVTGKGVRVAVLDSGIDLNHPDLAPNLNGGLSTSFTPEPLQTTDLYSHSSHVAGIIGAADNGFGTVGVAPDVELVAVKVLRDYGMGGAFSWVAAGIYYAVAHAKADIINMSLGAIIPRTQGQDNNNAGLTHLRNYVCKAVKYAKQQGVTVIVAAGNDGLDMQSPDNSHNLRFMGDCQDALVITAATPLGWASPPYTADLYQQASYSNYGDADFAGSGGSTDLIATKPFDLCNILGIVRYCWVFDLVFSTSGTGTWYWSAGTSMASPAAAGVAALIMSEELAKTGKKLNLAQLKTEMKRRALTGLGEDSNGNGRDDFFGMGHVHSGYY